MKVFISQPMSGRNWGDVLLERTKITIAMLERFGEDTVILDSIFVQNPNKKPLEYLGEAIILMAQADIVVVAPGWTDSRGCVIEVQCAIEYGINEIIYLKEV